MKKFIIKAGIIGLLPFIVLFIGYLVIPVKQNHWMRAYTKKCELLEATESPRIIFVGGSNLVHGLDSEKIKDSLNINVVNSALTIQLGLKFMIDDISTYANEGDIIVFAPEWHHFFNCMYGADCYLSIAIKLSEWSKLYLLNKDQIISVIKGIPDYILQNIIPQNITEKTLLPTNFNEFGDEVKHWSIDNKFKSNPGVILNNFDKDFGVYFINKLNELQTKCTVIMIPPACCDVAMKKWDKQVKEVEEYLEDNGNPFIIDPDSCSFGEEYMYDSDYHLNKKGVDIRTSLVIEALKQVLSEETSL